MQLFIVTASHQMKMILLNSSKMWKIDTKQYRGSCAVRRNFVFMYKLIHIYIVEFDIYAIITWS